MAYWVDFKTDDPFTTTFAYTTANELTKLTENGVDTTFTYNDWGRTVSKQKTVGQTTYTATYGYMYGDKLKSVASDFPGEAGEVAYNYDGLGKRRNKLVNDTDVTWWRWDAGWGMIAEYGQAGSWTVGDRQMSYTLDGMLALADVPGANPGNGDYRYYAQDHLGSLRALFDDDATQIGMADYEPYGMIRTGAGPADIPGQTFTGKMLDVETMLYYFPFRYYSPLSARWMSRDPLGMADGPNMYVYSTQSPTNFIDPLGLFTICTPLGDSISNKVIVTAGDWSYSGFQAAGGPLVNILLLLLNFVTVPGYITRSRPVTGFIEHEKTSLCVSTDYCSSIKIWIRYDYYSVPGSWIDTESCFTSLIWNHTSDGVIHYWHCYWNQDIKWGQQDPVPPSNPKSFTG